MTKTISSKKLLELAKKKAIKEGYTVVKNKITESTDIKSGGNTAEFKQFLNNISQLKFRPFTKHDWMGYGGCESPNPLICEDAEAFGNSIEHGVVILDGNTITIYKYDENDPDNDEENTIMYELKRLV